MLNNPVNISLQKWCRLDALNVVFECFNSNFNFWNILYWKLFVTSLTESLALCWSDNYVHRLVASKTDGKMVQYECEGDTCQDEKIDALQLEVCVCFVLDTLPSSYHFFKQIFFLQYSYLLTSQLESQRIYWENKIVHLEKDTAEEVRTAQFPWTNP